MTPAAAADALRTGVLRLYGAEEPSAESVVAAKGEAVADVEEDAEVEAEA
jgi:hypothetical protein